MRYTIGTGYRASESHGAAFFETWMKNTRGHANPVDLIVVNANSVPQPQLGGTWLNTFHNYGHVKTMEKGEKYGGWWLGFMMGAMMAYHNACDFIYKEQDCLAFGPWVKQLYDDAKQTDAPVLVGRFNHKYKIEQSLVWVRRKFIPKLINLYLSIPDTDVTLRPELKFLRIMKRHPKVVAFTRMGCGRNRPLPLEATCFYAQKLKPAELQALRTRGLL